MNNITKSASKIAFLLLISTACFAFLFTERLPVEQFMLLAIGASSFYYSNKGEPNEPYAGK